MLNFDGALSSYKMEGKRCALLASVLYLRQRKKEELNRRRRRRHWVRSINQRRNQQGDGANLVMELRVTDEEVHFQYCRMNIVDFERLLDRISPFIKRQVTNYREPVSERDRLYMTLRYLATGDAMSSMAFAFRVGRSTVSGIIADTCEQLWNVLQDELFQPSLEGWKKIAKDFEDRWNFPHCIGALDGKHRQIKAPPHAGSSFYNYKGFHSIVLMAVVSANYEFLMVDIGAEGRHSDGGIFINSEIGQRFHRAEMELPSPSPIGMSQGAVPYVLVADEAFQLNTFTLRPYPGRNLSSDKRIFNYRLSRARTVVENAFGILLARWRIFANPIPTSMATAEKIIKACVVLHNHLMRRNKYCEPGFADALKRDGQITNGEWRGQVGHNQMKSAGSLGSNMHSRYAASVRDCFTAYFNTEGAVDWQFQRANQ